MRFLGVTRRARFIVTVSAFAILTRCSSSPADIEPPAMPESGTAPTQAVSTFAIDAIRLGDADDAGAFDDAGWQLLGYDLDGKRTTRDSSDVCRLMPGAPRTDQVDGLGGRDNAFGSVILPIVLQLTTPITICFFCPPSPPPRVLTNDETAAIQQGKFTLQIQVAGLSDDPGQTAVGLTAQVFTSAAFTDAGATPAFDTTTDWPVQPESLVDASSIQGGASASFMAAYISNGTFVAGTNEEVTVPFFAEIDDFAFTLPIHSAILTFDHANPGEAANGVIAGVLDVTELTAIFRRQAGRITTSLCGGAFAGIAQHIGMAAEILLDRSNRAGVPCSGISIAMGFHAKRVANPTMIGAPTTISDRCSPDGG